MQAKKETLLSVPYEEGGGVKYLFVLIVVLESCAENWTTYNYLDKFCVIRRR